MDVILLVLHVSLALGIITLVMLQRGSGASAGAVFGGGGGDGGGGGSLFGAKGSANFLSRTTAILATAFFINSIVLSYNASHREAATSVTETTVNETVEVLPQPFLDADGEVPLADQFSPGTEDSAVSYDSEVPAAE